MNPEPSRGAGAKRRCRVFTIHRVRERTRVSKTAVTLVAAVTVGTIFFLLSGTGLAGETPRLFRIGTGGPTGVYYPIGKLIALGVTGTPAADDASVFDAENGVPGMIGVAQNSAGSVDNARAVTRGEMEAGIVQADVAFRCRKGQGPFGENAGGGSLRAVASLYSEKLQIVTRADAGIRRVADFRGKRLSLDETGSGTLAVMRIVLAAHELTESDFSPIYLKPAFTRKKMENGDIQGLAMMAGAPMEAVTQLAAVGLFLVPVTAETASRIHSEYPFLVSGTIPAGVYPGVPETPTLQVNALLTVDASLGEKLVYRVAAALWSDRTRLLLAQGHPQGKSVTLGTALEGISIPLHPGAARFYREKGMSP